MKFVWLSCALFCLLTVVSGFWDAKTSTLEPSHEGDITPRQSFFRWQETQPSWYSMFYPWWDWDRLHYNRRTVVIAGLSIDFLCLGTGTILNRRTILTSANLVDPWFNRQRDLRVWALGNAGTYKTPYRYRVWRTTRLFPKSLNPEHWHGARGIHSPRHDVCVIHTLDQMFFLKYYSYRGMYPTRAFLMWPYKTLSNDLWFAGSGYEYLEHIKENYKIFIAKTYRSLIVDCSKYLPKWWGKFICIINYQGFPGIQNGCGLFDNDGTDRVTGVGCFEIRYNEDRIYVFTDLRYYIHTLKKMAQIEPGEYYEYAYPHWGVTLGYIYDTYSANAPYIPHWQVAKDLYPLG